MAPPAARLLVRALRALHFAHVDFLVPNRFRFGYGLTPGIVAQAAAREPSLIVTVDNGVSSIEGVEAAHALGIPVLVTDHHLPGAHAAARGGHRESQSRGFALRESGAGRRRRCVLCRCGAGAGAGRSDFRAADLLDLVALGTVADMVPLDRNNRVLVAQGLRRIRAGRCVPGIRALLESAGRRLEQMSAADLGFAVAPRLNAAGRLTDMSVGIACLLADDPEQAARLAAQLAKLNEERREIEQRMQLEAVELAAAVRFDAAGSESARDCVCSMRAGIRASSGLVAGRIKDRLHRPVIAFARAEDGSLRGSARSVPGINIRDVLDSIAARHPGLIDKFGGHAMAAGMTLREASFEEFRAAFADEIAARTDVDALSGIIYSDGELTGAELCARDGARAARRRSLGPGISRAGLRRRSSASSDARIVGGRHLKLQLRGSGEAARSGPRCHCLRLRRRRARAPLDPRGRRGAGSPTGSRSTSTTARSACSSIVSTCSPRVRLSHPRESGVLRLAAMEINQLKRFIKDLEERTDSLRRYL